MSKTRNLSDLLDANGDVKSTALDNVPASNDASALTTGTLDSARLGTITNFTSTGIDDNATSTAVTLDSSGNLLVGATSATGIANGSSVNEGNAIIQSGGIAAQKNNDSPLYLSKASGYTYDGFARFIHNGIEVGKIGTADNDLFIGTQDTGIRFNDGLNAIYPVNASSYASLDNTINLGWNTVRWKDAYIGGNIYLGGTGSANALDDYEEGTWTPTMNFPTVSYFNQVGHYRKIGSMVYIDCMVQWYSASGYNNNDRLQINGLPFAVQNIHYRGVPGAVHVSTVNFNNTDNISATHISIGLGNNSTAAQIACCGSGASLSSIKNQNNQAGVISFTVCYRTSA